MGRIVIGNEGTIAIRYAALLKARTDLEVGLLIGHSNENKTTVISLVTTPDESEDSALDVASLCSRWVAAHKDQVARLLPGGLTVVGLYSFGLHRVVGELESKLKGVICSAEHGIYIHMVSGGSGYRTACLSCPTFILIAQGGAHPTVNLIVLVVSCLRRCDHTV